MRVPSLNFSFTFLLFLFSVVLSCAFATRLSYATSRRILHQPFFQQETPPSQTPSPSPPSKLPFSETTPNNSPFFPTYPSPPPPPTPSAFATFPANISSLILPQSTKPKQNTRKILLASLFAGLSSLIILGFFVLLHRRRRSNDRDPSDDKTYRSDNTNRQAVPTRNMRRTTSANSEFLYLGTIVNSHNVEGENRNSPTNAGSDPRKLDSPELHPLPPLNPRRNFQDGNTTGDDDEEFYSPRVSLGGRESSTPGTGSGSRRVFAAMVVDNSGSTSTSSDSSSHSGSPERFNSPSISPPVSSSPTGKATEPTATAPLSTSPDRGTKASFNGAGPSISLSPVSSSSNRTSFEKHQAVTTSPHVMSPSVSSGFASPNRVLDGTTQQLSPPRITDDDLLTQTSPERDFNKNNSNRPIVFPRLIRSRSSGQNRPPPSPLSSPSSSSSSSSSSSPARGLNGRISSILEQPVSVTPSPPPPPPPPPPITSRPPPLIPPSRPFVLQNSATKMSPMEVPPPNANTMDEESVEEENTQKPKLKPLHWDKVRASSDREMVWDHLKSSSFKLNEEMIETLFVVNTSNSKPKQQATQLGCAISVPNQENCVLDPKKAQNISILLRALNVTIDEVCEALLEGNADMLGAELLESLMKMAPTKEEERKLKDYKDDSPTKLGHAEKFLKAVLDVPFAFRRVEAMLYIANFETEVEYLKRSFETLEVACKELRNSRMFLKLLEAVLKTGNRMNVGTNRGDAHAFKLDTLLKLVDVKGADGKTTLLHFVVQEIIRTEGARISGTNQNPNSTASEDAKCRRLGLQVVSGLSSELANVKKAAGMDSDILSSDVSKLSRGLKDIGEVERLNETLVSDESSHRFSESMKRFVKMAEEEISKIQAQEGVTLSLVKEITEYFHGNSAKEEAHPFRIFMVVRDFLGILDRVCKEVGMINERTVVSSAYKFPVPVNPTLPPVFSGPEIVRQSSSDEEG